MPQISVHYLYNDISLSVSQGGFHCAINENGRVCIGDNSLRKYMPKHINPTSNRNNKLCWYETCISALLLQYYLNEWWLQQLENSEDLYLNAALTRIKKPRIWYDKIFPKSSQIHIRAYDAVS